MGNKIVYDPNASSSEQTHLTRELESLRELTPPVYTKIPRYVVNDIFENVDWYCLANRTNYIQLMNFLENINNYKLLRETWRGTITVKCDYITGQRKEQRIWKFFE